jgi:hypothetical protein
MFTKIVETRYYANGDKHTTTLKLEQDTILSARDKSALKSAIVALQAKWRKTTIPATITAANLDALCDLASATQRTIKLNDAVHAQSILDAIFAQYPELKTGK